MKEDIPNYQDDCMIEFPFDEFKNKTIIKDYFFTSSVNGQITNCMLHLNLNHPPILWKFIDKNNEELGFWKCYKCDLPMIPRTHCRCPICHGYKVYIFDYKIF